MADERQHSIGCPDAAMLRFLEDRESGEIGVGEHDLPFLFGNSTSLFFSLTA